MLSPCCCSKDQSCFTHCDLPSTHELPRSFCAARLVGELVQHGIKQCFIFPRPFHITFLSQFPGSDSSICTVGGEGAITAELWPRQRKPTASHPQAWLLLTNRQKRQCQRGWVFVTTLCKVLPHSSFLWHPAPSISVQDPAPQLKTQQKWVLPGFLWRMWPPAWRTTSWEWQPWHHYKILSLFMYLLAPCQTRHKKEIHLHPLLGSSASSEETLHDSGSGSKITLRLGASHLHISHSMLMVWHTHTKA